MALSQPLCIYKMDALAEPFDVLALYLYFIQHQVSFASIVMIDSRSLQKWIIKNLKALLTTNLLRFTQLRLLQGKPAF